MGESGVRIFESLKKPSWLTLDRVMFQKFLSFIYPMDNLTSLDMGWQMVGVQSEWDDE